MTYRITVEHGLAAHFNQPNGPSRPGVDWMLRIEGSKSGVSVVRTYLSGATAREEEKTLLAQKAVQYLQGRIESGWTPAIRDGVFEIPGL
jgi:hypothetical protein